MFNRTIFLKFSESYLKKLFMHAQLFILFIKIPQLLHFGKKFNSWKRVPCNIYIFFILICMKNTKCVYCRIKSGHADCTLFDQQSPPGKWQPTLVQRLCAVMQVVKIGGTCVCVELYTWKMNMNLKNIGLAQAAWTITGYRVQIEWTIIFSR